MLTNNNLKELVFSKLSQTRKYNQDYLFEIEQTLLNDEIYYNYTKQINILNFKLGKLKSENLPTNNLQEEIDALTKQQQNRLKQLNLSVNDTKLKFNCNKCEDTGIIDNNYCSCFKKIYNDLFLKQLGINNKQLHTFKDSTLKDNLELQQIYDKLYDYCKNFSKNSKNYVFYGKCGTGKTFLAESVASYLQSNFNVLYLNAFELNNIFIKYHTCDVLDKSFYFSAITEADLLIIDDLGTEPIYNKVTLEYLYLLINERTNKNNPFIITTNLSPKEIFDRYGERIFARIFQGNNKCCCLEFPNKNLRT